MMKKNKRLVLIVMILTSIGSFLFSTSSVLAVSREDVGYSSSSSFDSSSNWNYNSNSYRYGSTRKDNFFSGIILFVILMIVAVYFIKKNYKSNKMIKDVSSANLNKEYVSKEEEIKKVISDFNLEEFKNIVLEKYKQIQIAWMDFDYDSLRKNCTDELYHRYHSQLEILKSKNQKNIMSDFRQITFRVVGIEENKKEVSLKVRTTIWCYNYIIDQNQYVVKGDKNKKRIYHYELVLIRNENQDWILSKSKIISQK